METDRIFIVLIALYVILFFSTVSLILFNPQFLGLTIFAEGGNVTKLDVNMPMPIINWDFIYGNVSFGGQTDVTVNGGGVTYIDIRSIIVDEDIWIVASENPVNVSQFVPADLNDIDTFMGLGVGDAMSATNTFMDWSNFTIGNTTYEMWTTDTNSDVGSYTLAAFEDNGTLAFVTKLTAGIGFNNDSHLYQMLLPRGPAPVTYLLRIYTNMTITMDMTGSRNVSARINGSDVEVYWDPTPGATYYTVFAVDTSLNNSFPDQYYINRSAAVELGNTTDLNWTDSGVVGVIDERYYWIEARSGALTRPYDSNGALYTINLTNDGSNGMNLVSTPVELEETNITRVLSPIFPVLLNVYHWDNTLKGYSVFFVIPDGMGGWIPIDTVYDMYPAEGYWVEVSTDTSLPVAGRLLNKTMANITPSMNVISYHMIQGNNSVTTIFDDYYSNLLNIYWYDNVNKGYRIFTVIPDGMGGWIPVPLFDYVRPGQGYYMEISADTEVREP